MITEAAAPVAAARYPALQSPNYRLYTVGNVVSQIGSWMQTTAQGWLVFQLTGSPFDLGLVGSLGWVPSLVIAPVGGVLADRFDRRLMLIVTQAVALVLALALAVLTSTRLVTVEHVIVIAFLLGLVLVVDYPARQALITELVDESALMNAVTLDSGVLAIARAVGPAIAGVVVASLGIAWCFYVNALSYVAVILVLAAIRPRPTVSAPRPRGWGQFMEGFRYVWQRPVLAAAIGLAAMSTVLLLPAATIMPVFAGEVLAVGPVGLGLLLGSIGAGSVAGAAVLASLRRLPPKGILLVACGAIFAGTTLGFALSRSYPLSLGLLFASGAASVGLISTTRTLLQLGTPRELRGRVMAVFQLAFRGLVPVGALQIGAVAALLGAPFAVGLSAVLSGLTLLAVVLAVPALRRTG